eukprot:2491565-Alexandrium_andersonii.AAC.1
MPPASAMPSVASKSPASRIANRQRGLCQMGPVTAPGQEYHRCAGARVAVIRAGLRWVGRGGD